jgi:hypothetical protein
MSSRRTAKLSSIAANPALVAGVLVIALYAAHVLRFVDYVNDDAYISFRYARNIATGVGPYFNPGEHVEGYTNLSLVLAMAGVHAIAGDAAVPIAAKGLGLLSAAATLLLAIAIARRLAPAVDVSAREGLIWGALAAGLVAASPGFVVNSVSGLETVILAACLTAAVWCDTGDRPGWRGTAIWFGIAMLTRPDVIVVIGAYLFARFAQAYRRRGTAAASTGTPNAGVRELMRVVVSLSLVLGSHLLLRYLAYDGELLPNTYYAKAGGFWGTGAWTYIRDGALAPLLGLGGAALAMLGWITPGRPRTPMVPIAFGAVAGASLPFVTGADWMLGWRFVAPYLPLLALTFVFGWIRLTGLGGRRKGQVAVALLIALPLAWFSQAHSRDRFERYVTVKARGYQNGHRAAADWILNAGAEPGDLIALMDIGIISYTCSEQRILDITGLTDRVIAQSPGAFLSKEYDPKYVLDQEPDFIVLAYVVAGDPEHPPQLGLPIHSWSKMESRLSEQSDFEQWYIEPHDPSAATDWRSWYANRLGAAEIFWHNEPEIHYLLAVFKRQPEPANDTG